MNKLFNGYYLLGVQKILPKKVKLDFEFVDIFAENNNGEWDQRLHIKLLIPNILKGNIGQ